MVTTVASNEADYKIVYQRIADAFGDPNILDPDNINGNSINIIDDTNGVIRLVFSTFTNCWYVQHLWGDKTTWLPLLKAMNAELISRGEENTPVRWRDTPNSVLNTFVNKLKIRTVIDEEINKDMYEITPLEAVSVLTTI